MIPKLRFLGKIFFNADFGRKALAGSLALVIFYTEAIMALHCPVSPFL
jgi:hypothetical protein